MKTFKKLSLIFMSLALVSLYSCEAPKSEEVKVKPKTEDEKIQEAFVGKFYEDDDETDDGVTVKNQKGEFYKDGKFDQEATFEVFDQTSMDFTDLRFVLKGEWSIKDKFLYFKPDYNAIKIFPEMYEELYKEDFIKNMKEKNTPFKIIDYDASKIIYEDSDGERKTMKKVY